MSVLTICVSKHLIRETISQTQSYIFRTFLGDIMLEMGEKLVLFRDVESCIEDIYEYQRALHHNPVFEGATSEFYKEIDSKLRIIGRKTPVHDTATIAMLCLCYSRLNTIAEYERDNYYGTCG